MINGLDIFYIIKVNKGEGLKLVENKGDGLNLVKGRECYVTKKILRKNFKKGLVLKF